MITFPESVGQYKHLNLHTQIMRKLNEPYSSKDGVQAAFKQEVSETVLRCVRDRHNLDNAIVELNSLKLAENRTFADLARYVSTTLLGLCLTAPARLDEEYKSLFPKSMPANDAEVQFG